MRMLRGLGSFLYSPLSPHAAGVVLSLFVFACSLGPRVPRSVAHSYVTSLLFMFECGTDHAEAKERDARACQVGQCWLLIGPTV